MFKKSKLPLIIVSLMVLTLSLGAMAFTSFPVTGLGFGGNAEGGRGRGDFGNKKYLAEALGITVEELQSAFVEVRSTTEKGVDFNEALAAALGIGKDALEAAQDTALDQALVEGEITQKEYDQIKTCQALQKYLDRDAILAEALGISVAELQASQETGKNIPDLLDELGIDRETFQANMQAAHDAAIAEAIADGVITQEQADQLQAGGFGGRDGKGRRRPGGDGRGPGGPGGKGGPDNQGSLGGPGGNNG